MKCKIKNRFKMFKIKTIFHNFKYYQRKISEHEKMNVLFIEIILEFLRLLRIY